MLSGNKKLKTLSFLYFLTKEKYGFDRPYVYVVLVDLQLEYCPVISMLRFGFICRSIAIMG